MDKISDDRRRSHILAHIRSLKRNTAYKTKDIVKWIWRHNLARLKTPYSRYDIKKMVKMGERYKGGEK